MRPARRDRPTAAVQGRASSWYDDKSPMDQRIGFCTTSDGLTIAYATAGEGPPLVYANGWPGHLALEWEMPVARGLLEELAQGATLVRYDMRGSGLSDRNVDDLSVESCVKDLEAVVDHLKLDQFYLLSLGLFAGPIAIAYAAAHPERVSKIILAGAYLRGSDVTTPEKGRALADYISQFGFPLNVGDVDPNDLPQYQEVMRIQREGASTEVQGAVVRAMIAADVRGVVRQLAAG